MQDASDVMQLLLKTQTDFSDMEDDDPQVSRALNASYSVCWLVGWLVGFVFCVTYFVCTYMRMHFVHACRKL